MDLEDVLQGSGWHWAITGLSQVPLSTQLPPSQQRRVKEDIAGLTLLHSELNVLGSKKHV